MNLTSDWHIHSEHSCDSACMPVADLPGHTARRGILDYGVTDHLHTPFNWPDVKASRLSYLATHPSPHFHFGIELSCVSQWELEELAKGGHADPVYGLREGGPVSAAPALAITAEELRAMGIEYVVAGVHWPLYVPLERQAVIRDYHRQLMFLATHPLVTIVAHPWWWMGHWKDAAGKYSTEPWFDDFRVIPASLHDELAAALREHGTVLEINIWATLKNYEYPPHFAGQYLEYLAGMKERGVKFSIGSDTHDRNYTADFEDAARLLEKAGFKESDFWRLPPRGAA